MGDEIVKIYTWRGKTGTVLELKKQLSAKDYDDFKFDRFGRAYITDWPVRPACDCECGDTTLGCRRCLGYCVRCGANMADSKTCNLPSTNLQAP